MGLRFHGDTRTEIDLDNASRRRNPSSQVRSGDDMAVC
jgi:hypothetical protein